MISRIFDLHCEMTKSHHLFQFIPFSSLLLMTFRITIAISRRSSNQFGDKFDFPKMGVAALSSSFGHL